MPRPGGVTLCVMLENCQPFAVDAGNDNTEPGSDSRWQGQDSQGAMKLVFDPVGTQLWCP